MLLKQLFGKLIQILAKQASNYGKINGNHWSYNWPKLFCFGIASGRSRETYRFHFYMYKQEVLIREMIGNVYLECKGFGKISV